ncbi:MAG: N-acetylgalactosamine 6-sulfate sulfatase (GALNS), partial [Lentisphaeraceae bacterium]|nr:N-acetylgalactosamine 6-sulfate sulfatase (GALNS) [Lentisphaeraceae bacterium]
QIPQGSTYQGRINQLDFFPTILKLTNSSIKTVHAQELSGLDISPVLTQNAQHVTNSSGAIREELFWHFPHNDDQTMQSTVRRGDFKLYKNYHDMSYSLFRLYKNGQRNDIEERHNLANEPEFAPILQKLKDKLNALLIANNAEAPSYNSTYRGDVAHKNKIALIKSTHFYTINHSASLTVDTKKAANQRAYVLYKRDSFKRKKKKLSYYDRLPAAVSKSGRQVSANIPSQVKEFLFVLVDENNFMIKSKKILTK